MRSIQHLSLKAHSAFARVVIERGYNRRCMRNFIDAGSEGLVDNVHLIGVYSDFSKKTLSPGCSTIGFQSLGVFKIAEYGIDRLALAGSRSRQAKLPGHLVGER